MKKEVTTENQDARIEEGAETVALGGPLHVEYILAVLPSRCLSTKLSPKNLNSHP